MWRSVSSDRRDVLGLNRRPSWLFELFLCVCRIVLADEVRDPAWTANIQYTLQNMGNTGVIPLWGTGVPDPLPSLRYVGLSLAALKDSEEGAREPPKKSATNT